MSSFKTIDSKREEFRKYLEKAGVVDVLTKVLVGLYEEPEKPENALEYLKKSMSVKSPENVEIESLRLELEELRSKVEELIEENNKLKSKLVALDPKAATASGEASKKEVC